MRLLAQRRTQEEQRLSSMRKKRRLSGKQPAPVPNPWEFHGPISSGGCASAAVRGQRLARPVVEKPLCFSSTGVELSRVQKQFLSQTLRAKFVAEWSPEVTHLISDAFRRTTKFMCAVCAGVRIVTPAFLDHCLSVGSLLDDRPFILRDVVGEDAFGKKHGLANFSVASALERSRHDGPLLNGVAVHCLSSVVGRAELQVVVEAAGGKWLETCPPVDSLQSTFLLGQAGIRLSVQEMKSLHGGEIYDVELLREATCTQVLRPDLYRLRSS